MEMLNLNKKIDNLYLNKKTSPKKKFLVRILVLVAVVLIFIIFPVIFTYLGFKGLSKAGKDISSGYKGQNFDLIQKGVSSSKSSLSMADFSLNFLFWVRVIPVFGGYYADLKSFTSSGVLELKAMSQILKDLEPAKIELGFNNQPLAGQDRVTQVVKVLNKALPNIDKVIPDLKKAAELVSKIDTSKYPENFRGMKLRDVLSETKGSILGVYIAVSDGKQVLMKSPEALGANKAVDYLLLFQNDKEIRATGGFMTAYAGLKLDKGKISTGVSDDIYRLDEMLLEVCKKKICPLTPPTPIIKYLPEFDGKPRKAWSMRDSNLSPDVPTSAKEFESMYNLMGNNFPYEGIIYIDTQVVEKLIEITGPIDVYGTKYSAEIDPRCNCPNVIYGLEDYAEVAAKGEKDRKAVLGVLMQQILARSLGADVEKIPQLLQTIVTLANEKHIIFYMHDKDLQHGLSNLSWTGEVKNVENSDYLYINDSNFAGGKSNLYVEQTVTQAIEVKSGVVKKKITIEYENLQQFNSWLNGINRDYVRVYVPKGSKLISSKGSEDKVETLEDLNKTVFTAFIQVRPQNTRKLEFEYEIPYKPTKEYKILIQRQPGAKEFKYIINLNGHQKESFLLNMDKEFTLPL